MSLAPAATSDNPIPPEMLPTRFSSMALKWARETPDRIAFETKTQAVTWGEAGASIERTVEQLRALGVRPGDRVMVVNENGLAGAILAFAITHMDGWVSLLNGRMSAREVETMRAFADIRLVLYTTSDSQAAATRAAELSESHTLTDPVWGEVVAGPLNGSSVPEKVNPTNEQIAVLTFTSGTTGNPKAVMLSHRAVCYTAFSQSYTRHITQDDCIYIVSPLSHSIGLSSNLLAAATVGAKSILVPAFEPAHLAQCMVEKKVTFMIAVPQVFARLLDYADKANIDLSDTGIRALGCGGAPLDPALKERVKRTFGVPIGNGYGATEMVPVCRVPDGVDADGDVVGQPQPGVEVLLMKEDGTQAKDGEVGEMWVRGPSLMSGYYRNEAETRAVMRPGGWLATGDLGMRMPDGAYRIAGRIKELIIRSGFNVYPVEVEAVLTTHPAVGQAAVVGRSVPGNEEVVAFVQLLPNRSTNAEELTAYLRERLAAYKVPCQVYIQELPIGPTGKILKIALRNQAQAAVAEPL
jgi:acyl-CoA synthetase (AMP-forming)/AMP-acid ligase II